MPLEIVTLPTLADNYNFLIHDSDTGRTALIDAPEDDTIAAQITARGWQLDEIWLTHHHWDHIDGAAALSTEFGATITGATADAHRLPPLTRSLAPGDSFEFAGHRVDILDVPGHTVGHIAYYIPSASALFSGDSLMALGCGRLFEGTADQMYQSLSTLAALPADTFVYSGHEYTAANAAFALSLEPENTNLQNRAKLIEDARSANNPTVPSLLSDELATNPFLRSHSDEVQASLGMQGRALNEVFAATRKAKDNF